MRALFLRHRLQVVAYAFVVAMSAFGLWLVEHRADQGTAALKEEIAAREHHDCLQANDRRADLRHALADVLTDNLVEAADTDPPPEVVEEFRQNLLDDLETEFPDLRCPS